MKKLFKSLVSLTPIFALIAGTALMKSCLGDEEKSNPNQETCIQQDVNKKQGTKDLTSVPCLKK